MASRTFQPNAFQFKPEAFQAAQAVIASGTFGINHAFAATARITLRAPATLAIRDAMGAAARTADGAAGSFVASLSAATAAGLTFFNAAALGLRKGQSSTVQAAQVNASAAFALAGAI